jgi:hypothetical protein
MRLILSIAIIACCMFSYYITFSQSLPSLRGLEPILKKHSIEWMQALERKDSAVLEAYLAKEFILGGIGDGNQVDRSTWLKNAYGKDWTKTRYEFLQVQLKDSNAAIVNSRMRFKVNPVPFAITSNVIDYWVYRNGRWQVTERLIGADSITNLISGVKGFLIGIIFMLFILLVRRLLKRRRREAAMVTTGNL